MKTADYKVVIGKALTQIGLEINQDFAKKHFFR